MLEWMRRGFVGSVVMVLAASVGCGGSSSGGGGTPAPDLRAIAGSVTVPASVTASAVGATVNLFELADSGLVGPLASTEVTEDGNYAFGGVDVSLDATVVVVAEILRDLTGARVDAQTAAPIAIGGTAGPGFERENLSGVTEIARVALLELIRAGVLGAAEVDAQRIFNLEAGAATLADQVDFNDPMQVAMAATQVNVLTENGTTDGSQPPPMAECGNGDTELDEQCDDGEANIEPGTCEAGEICCTTDCVLEEPMGPVCGDGERESGEECDEGEDNVDRDDCAPGTTCCTLRCTLFSQPNPPICGNGLLEPGEQCDQGVGNVAPGVCVTLELPACCTTGCLIEIVPGCGNFLVENGEECDEGPNGGVACCPDCVFRNMQGECF